jgi:hypothetical protein
MRSLPPEIGSPAAFVALSHVNSTCIYWIGNCTIVAQVPRSRTHTQTVQGCDPGSAIRVIGDNPKGPEARNSEHNPARLNSKEIRAGMR